MKTQFALALLLAVAPLAASAGELSYTYVEAGIAQVDVDIDEFASSVDFDGFQLRGSVAVSDAFYLFGGHGSTNNDDAGLDIDFSESQFGVGYHFGLSERADLLAELGAVRQEIDFDGIGSVEADGGRASVGVRALLSDNFEGWVKASYSDGGDFDGGFSGLVGAQWKFNPTWGLIGEIESGELDEQADLTKYLVGVRASF
jgi:hypothetical protein